MLSRIVSVPPSVRRRYGGTEVEQQADWCHVIMVVSEGVTMTAAIIELSL